MLSKRKRITSLGLGADLLFSFLGIASEPDDSEIYEDENSPLRLALFNIELLAEHLPPEHIAAPFLVRWPQLINSSNKYERRASLAALGGVMRGSSEFMTQYTDQLLPDVIRVLKTTEGSVVRVALITLSQLTEVVPEKVTQHHSIVIPTVFEVMKFAIAQPPEKLLNGLAVHNATSDQPLLIPTGPSDMQTIRVACETLDTILEWIPPESIPPYLPHLMDLLLYVLKTDADSDVKTIAISKPPFISGKKILII